MIDEGVLEIREAGRWHGDGVRFIRIMGAEERSIEIEIMYDGGQFCSPITTLTDERRRELITFLQSVDAATKEATL